jgi:hypothetical protein
LKQTHRQAHPANGRKAKAAPLPVPSRDDERKLALYRRNKR